MQKMQETPSAAGGRPATLCSLDMVISVAYRVTNSKQATMLRIWATDKLVQILTKGFYIDKDQLKNQGAPDVLDEFREIAREIRTSIRNSYREVLKLCTLCGDCDGTSKAAREFLQAMENKLLWAATNRTGPQLILERCDASKRNLGLSSFRRASWAYSSGTSLSPTIILRRGRQKLEIVLQRCGSPMLRSSLTKDGSRQWRPPGRSLTGL